VDFLAGPAFDTAKIGVHGEAETINEAGGGGKVICRFADFVIC
jgi:hypothetical protein